MAGIYTELTDKQFRVDITREKEETKMNENVKIRKKTLKLAISITCIVLAILIALSGVLGYNLLKAYRMNRYSKNIWLGNNYFLTKYDDEVEEAANDGDMELHVSTPSDEISETELSTNLYDMMREISEFSSSLYKVIYDMYTNGSFSDDDIAQIYILFKKGATDEVVNAINETAEEEIISADMLTRKLSVPYVSQEGILPNGCEAVSGVMLLKDKGYDVDPVDFVDNYLSCGEVKVKWGCRYGPDPSKQYAGDPKSAKGGWGCFAPVIVDSLNKYLPDKKYYACNLSGQDLSTLAADYVAKGIPVAVWCTVSMQEINEVYQWQSYDKKQTYLYPVGQHCMVLIGYDEEYYYFLDPYNSNGEVKHPKNQSEYCYNSIGKQAVAILEKRK